MAEKEAREEGGGEEKEEAEDSQRQCPGIIQVFEYYEFFSNLLEMHREPKLNAYKTPFTTTKLN